MSSAVELTSDDETQIDWPCDVRKLGDLIIYEYSRMLWLVAVAISLNTIETSG
jgi:hypothetical protein